MRILAKAAVVMLTALFVSACKPLVGVVGVASSFPTQKNVQVSCSVIDRKGLDGLTETMAARYAAGWRANLTGFLGDDVLLCFERPRAISAEGRPSARKVSWSVTGKHANDDARAKCDRIINQSGLERDPNAKIRAKVFFYGDQSKVTISSTEQGVLSDVAHPDATIETLCSEAAMRLEAVVPAE